MAAALLAAPGLAQKWQKQYLHEDAKTRLMLVDIAFASPQRGVAVGATFRRDLAGASPKPVSLVTSDGGQHWVALPLEELPVSLFFLNENLGFLVTERALWKTVEAGRQWTKVSKPPARVLQVYFADDKRGWAACERKTALATTDGGVTWTKIKEAADAPGEAARTSFHWIAFRGQRGVMLGHNSIARPAGLPAWLEPQRALRERETPEVAMTLETENGGAIWVVNAARAMGQISRFRFGPDWTAMLVEHAVSYQYPSEIVVAQEGAQMLTRYHDPKTLITDLWAGEDGALYAAGVAAIAPLRGVVPEKVRALHTRDFKTWTSVEVDYRALGNSVRLAGAGNDLWMATDRGMILKLVR